MRRESLSLAALAMLLAFSVASVDASPRFVGTVGNDGNPGTIGAPWQTLDFAFGQLSPGDTLYIRGGRYHELLGAAPFRGETTTAASFELVDLGPYPALVSGGATAVAGELFLVDQAILSKLDELEGHPSYYQRRVIELEGGQHAVAYVMPRSDAGDRPRIASGDWRRR